MLHDLEENKGASGEWGGSHWEGEFWAKTYRRSEGEACRNLGGEGSKQRKQPGEGTEAEAGRAGIFEEYGE